MKAAAELVQFQNFTRHATVSSLLTIKQLEELKSSPGGVKSFLNDHDDFKHYGCGTIITAVKK